MRAMCAPFSAETAAGGSTGNLACAVVDALADQMAVLSEDGTIIAVNQSWNNFSADNRPPLASPASDVGTNYLAVCRDTDDGSGLAAAAGIAAVLAGGTDSFSMEYDCHRPERQRWFRMTVTRLGAGLDGAIVVHHEITAQRAADVDLRIAAVALESFEGIMVTDAEGVILRVNQGFTRITGYSAAEAVGLRPSMLSSGRHDAAFYGHMWTEIRSAGHWEGEIWNRRKSGQVYPEFLSIAAVRDAQGAISHYVAVLTDITQRKADSDAIRNLAFYDPLTRLPNRRLLLERLRQQLRGGERRDSYGALMFIDLDNFKLLNDSYGHNVGDLLLQQVARRLQDSLREADTVARLGGDEFVVLCDGFGAESMAAPQAKALGSKLLAALNLPYLLDGHVCHSTPSIGITLFCQGGTASPDELLGQADAAMYEAKQNGRNSLRFFDQTMQESIDRRHRRERMLRDAVALRQFEMHYQLQVDIGGRPCGIQAQPRWRRPDGVLEPAEQFIGLAEEAGLLAPLGDWALEQVCTQLHAWQDHPVLGRLPAALKVSAAQWRQPDFRERVAAAVARHGIQKATLRLELPEALLARYEEAAASMAALYRDGVRFALQDLGTGATSLRRLWRLPLDQLKIDASLIDELSAGDGAQAVVLAIISIGSALRLEVTAEGIDTQAQREQLQALGCHRYQGHWHSPPLPQAEFEARARSLPEDPSDRLDKNLST